MVLVNRIGGWLINTTINASRYRARASRPSARKRSLRGFLLIAQPPLCEEGNIPREPKLPIFELSHYTLS